MVWESGSIFAFQKKPVCITALREQLEKLGMLEILLVMTKSNKI